MIMCVSNPITIVAIQVESVVQAEKVTADSVTVVEKATDEELLAALDHLNPQWSSISAAKVRMLLRSNGFVVSEKRAKALKMRS